MELRRPFGIDDLLSPANADAIYDRCNELLATDALRVCGLLRDFDVRALCTTDDPADDLAAHRRIAADPAITVIVAPAFRPDRAVAAADPASYNAYLDRLGAAAGIDIAGYDDLLQALEQRHAWFHDPGLPAVRPRPGTDLRRPVHGRGCRRRVREGACRHCTRGGRIAHAAVGAAA